MTGELTHIAADGSARMVDVSDKDVTERLARAAGVIRMQRATLDAIRSSTLEKGDVIAVARVAAIMAAKRTAELIPLCHPLPLTSVEVEFELDDDAPGVRAVATVRTSARTGVEMEALTAVAVGLVTIYDMAKGIDRGMSIGEIRVIEKRGGRSG